MIIKSQGARAEWRSKESPSIPRIGGHYLHLTWRQMKQWKRPQNNKSTETSSFLFTALEKAVFIYHFAACLISIHPNHDFCTLSNGEPPRDSMEIILFIIVVFLFFFLIRRTPCCEQLLYFWRGYFWSFDQWSPKAKGNRFCSLSPRYWVTLLTLPLTFYVFLGYARAVRLQFRAEYPSAGDQWASRFKGLCERSNDGTETPGREFQIIPSHALELLKDKCYIFHYHRREFLWLPL